MKNCRNLMIAALALAWTFIFATVGNAANSSATPNEYWWHTAPTNLTVKGNAKKRALTATVVDRPAFQWQQIESTNYVDYVKNLRSIGCPEQTLRDIVSADVIQAYASRRSTAMVTRYQDFKFWKADPQAIAELARQRRSIDADVERNLHLLLGNDFVAPSMTADWRAAELDQQLAFLTPDKRDKVLPVLLRYAENDAQVMMLADNRRRNEDLEELQRLVEEDDQKRATLTSLLLPEEYKMVDMVCSCTGHNLRGAMTHFNPTETEFRALFRIWREQDDLLARAYAYGKPDPDNREEVLEKAKQVLTPERYAEYRSTWWE